MTEHRLLTGDSLHEPKGVENATSGQVYIANGSGSGAWTDRLSGIYNLNSFGLSGTIPDVSTSGSSFYVTVPVKATLVKLYAVLGASISGANATVTILKNGVAQTPTLTVPFAGSGAGVASTLAITPNIPVVEGDVLQVRSGGGSTGAASLAVSLRLTAVA